MKTVLAVLIIVLLGACAFAAETVVYSDDFEGTVGSEWSHANTAVTPLGGRSFLGRFCNDWVTLDLTELPEHSHVQVSFDLFLIQSWDGNGGIGDPGPDIWSLRVIDGSVLLSTTFCNWMPDYGWPEGRQSYPGPYPSDEVARTGASENNTLGYYFSGKPVDSVYCLQFGFAHSADAVQFEFGSNTLSSIGDESWGIDNVTVSVTPVCEPSTIGVLMFGILGSCRAMRVRRE